MNDSAKSTGTKKKATELQYWLYSTGNFPNNIIFLMVGTYLTYFYTNILGISPIMAGTIFMVARLVDAITDPLMGMIVDRTNTKLGRFRPYIIAGAPFLCTLLPIAGYIASLISMYFYPMDRKGEVELQEKLDAMEQKTQDADLAI